MSRRLCLLFAVFCLGLLAAPTLAAPKAAAAIPTPAHLMEDTGDLASELEEWVAETRADKLLSAKAFADLEALLGDDAGEVFVLIGTARAKALANNKPVPSLTKIKGAQPIPLEATYAWGAELDAELEAVKNKLDSMSEMDEMEALRLQMAMDRLSKMMSTLSNLLKKISDTQEAITQNLK